MKQKKSPAPEEDGPTTVCANKQTVNDSLQEFQSGVKVRRGRGSMKEPIAYFHRDGKPGMVINFTPEKKKELTRKLRDENIRIEEERGREELIENSRKPIKFNLTPAEIREKLRGGKHGKQKNG